MAKIFMEAGTEIEGMIEKKNQCLVKIANVLTDACITRGQNGKINSLETDISNVIRSLPLEDQVVILRKVTVALTSQISGGKSSNDDNRRSHTRRNDIFACRSF